jgi:hypothetical protein
LRPVVFKDNYRFYTSHFTRRIGFIATSSKALYLASADELNICSSSAVIGEEIIILGFPRVGNQDGLTLSRGIISGIEGNHYVTDAKVEFGSSGGAAISVGRNCFIGIPSFIVQGEAETFARILDVSNLLDNN